MLQRRKQSLFISSSVVSLSPSTALSDSGFVSSKKLIHWHSQSMLLLSCVGPSCWLSSIDTTKETCVPFLLVGLIHANRLTSSLIQTSPNTAALLGKSVSIKYLGKYTNISSKYYKINILSISVDEIMTFIIKCI